MTVCYTPADSGYTNCKIIVENDLCTSVFFASGGFPGIKPNKQTLKLLHPNGGEVFVAGSDTVITWEGVLPDEPVSIEYSTNNGLTWIVIKNDANGLTYHWKVPNTPSKNCLARVTANLDSSSINPNIFICDQIWMAKNLDASYYRNGDEITFAKTGDEWRRANSRYEGAWCYYGFDPENGEKYGKLYNWYAIADSRGLAPVGWHIPTDEEWIELEMCLGLTKDEANEMGYRGTYQGGMLKETGIGNWLYPNTGATNETGFTALPCGYVRSLGTFTNIGLTGLWWSATKHTNDFEAICRYLDFNFSGIYRTLSIMGNGYSVRCVMDY